MTRQEKWSIHNKQRERKLKMYRPEDKECELCTLIVKVDANVNVQVDNVPIDNGSLNF